MIKLPIVSQGIALQELPGQIAVCFEFGSCTQKCKGCHSNYHCAYIHPELYTDLTEIVAYAKAEKERGATSILLMGGTTNRIGLETLGKAIQELSKILPVGIYSGANENTQATKFLKELPGLRWLKTGAYKEELGGLASEKTNQRFYQRKNECDTWKDVTFLFRGETYD